MVHLREIGGGNALKSCKANKKKTTRHVPDVHAQDSWTGRRIRDTNDINTVPFLAQIDRFVFLDLNALS